MTQGSQKQRAVLRRFTMACEQDERVVAAFLGGSLAASKADEGSDLDIYLVTSDEGYDQFFAERRAFMQQLGRAVFLEDFNDFGFDMVLFTFDDGVEGELSMAKESSFDHIHGGAYEVLVDKKGLLVSKAFPLYKLTEEEQRKTLHTAIYWFWDHLSHFVASMVRKRAWSAYGSLDEMRMKCLKLVRLKHDFTAEHSAYSKIEEYVPEEELRPLIATCCPAEPEAMFEAALLLVRFYQEIAPALAVEHGIGYPADLEGVQMKRLEKLRASAPIQ